MSNHNQLKLISSHPNCEVKQHLLTKQNGLYTTAPFCKGDIIIDFGSSKIVTTPNYLTVQIGEDKHIHLSPEYLQYTNHACEPNVLFNTSTMQLECLTDVAIGDELTFFYPATEWEISQTFNCHCGKPACVGLIKGASELSVDVLRKYKLTEFIESMAQKYKGL
ncbi:MAG: SET domain-containing protein [Bacteroidetes bacterium]|jgi:hypothetical protein|nr:SET domain-containing protein [Bacteroidota bacterium]